MGAILDLPMFVEEQHDAAGDIVWALTGRGTPFLSHSITSVEAAILQRLEPTELCELGQTSPLHAVKVLNRMELE